MYQVTFVDGEIFTGGEPSNSMWDKLPNKQIKSIVYWLNEDIKFSFTDFEEYCHCIEHVRGINNGIDTVSKAIIMGKVKDRVYQVIFDLKKGNIHQLVTPFGKEYSSRERLDDTGKFVGYIGGQPITGWKEGIQNAEYPGPKLKKIE